jgi:hypothetical protein
LFELRGPNLPDTIKEWPWNRHAQRGLKPIDMKVCYWALLFMPLVILHHLLNVFVVQLANKRGFTTTTKKNLLSNVLIRNYANAKLGC